MPGEPKRLNHPFFVYFFALFFASITLAVISAIVFHLTFSHHGPELLAPLIKKFNEETKSEILEEAKRLEELEIHRHFHNIVEYPQQPEKDRPVCFICHSQQPHSKKKKVRSLLNIHTQYFVCEVCHIDKKDNEIVHKWYNPIDPKPSGPFFGTKYEPETGFLVEVEDKISRIAPFFRKDGNLESAIQKQDAPLALDYMKVRDKLTPEQRDGVKKKFHENIKPKGHNCENCHSDKSILNFKELGFSESRTKDLVRLNISGMITKYETFYLPNLFKEPEVKENEADNKVIEFGPRGQEEKLKDDGKDGEPKGSESTPEEKLIPETTTEELPNVQEAEETEKIE